MYEKGETNYLDLLFKSADLTQLFNGAEYIGSVAAYDRKMPESCARSWEKDISAREQCIKAMEAKYCGKSKRHGKRLNRREKRIIRWLSGILILYDPARREAVF